MNIHDDVPTRSEDLPSSLPRTSSIADFSKLFRRRRHARKTRSRYSQSLDGSETYGSENSQILYMASKQKSQTRDRSLSCISNGSNRRMDGSSDRKTNINEEDLEQEAYLNIIDREIFEWQYVCQTGRPYWWSPEAKYHRIKKVPPRIRNEPSPRIWYKEIDERPRTAYAVQRRAVSESFLSDPTTVHDVAHLVAIQLLGACFTLPPDSIVGLPAPNYTGLGKHGSTRFPDPRMISSLRMHTNFRYSPSFGHQARSSSPVQMWPGTYDGPSIVSSPPAADIRAVTPDIGTSESRSKRPRLHQALRPTEGTGSSGDSDSAEFDSCCRKGALDLSIEKNAWYRRQGFHDPYCKSFKVPKLPRKSGAFREEFDERDHKSSGTSRGFKPSQQHPKMNYRLQPTIRSEPHHVFIQPVRELVVKRWRSFTRRFGGSLHSALPSSHSEYPTSGSESGASEASSPAVSTDARKRRLRAQERGDIHSSSVESTPHFNSPASEMFSPPDASGRISPLSIVSPSALGIPVDTPSESESITIGKGNRPMAETTSSFESIMFGRSLTSPKRSTLATPGTGNSRLESPLSFTSKSASPTSSNPYSSRRAANRRRSMLSEVCTPEDFQSGSGAKEVAERSILSAAGSTLASPIQEAPPSLSTQVRRQEFESSNVGLTFGAYNNAEVRVSHRERPGFPRTSTSGTQIFTPEADGVEVDGLPVGPDRSHWVSKGGRRERTYL